MYETLDAKEIQLVLEGKTLETRWTLRGPKYLWAQAEEEVDFKRSTDRKRKDELRGLHL